MPTEVQRGQGVKALGASVRPQGLEGVGGGLWRWEGWEKDGDGEKSGREPYGCMAPLHLAKDINHQII